MCGLNACLLPAIYSFTHDGTLPKQAIQVCSFLPSNRNFQFSLFAQNGIGDREKLDTLNYRGFHRINSTSSKSITLLANLI